MAQATTKNHDYHLVDPSQWPVISTLSAFVVGGQGDLSDQHSYFSAAPDRIRNWRARHPLHDDRLVARCHP